jgi:hypothetical protein
VEYASEATVTQHTCFCTSVDPRTQLPKTFCSSPEINVYLMSAHPKVTRYYSIYRNDTSFTPVTGKGKNPTPIRFIQ